MTDASYPDLEPFRWVVLRADRPSIPTYCPDADTARAIAEERVTANGGEYLVAQVVGRARPITEWVTVPSPAGEPPPAPAPWRTYP